MKFSTAIRPISYLKAHASEIINSIHANADAMIITQNGEARVVIQDIRTYEQTRESLAMLKILAQSSKKVEKGDISSADDSFSRLEKRINKEKQP